MAFPMLFISFLIMKYPFSHWFYHKNTQTDSMKETVFSTFSWFLWNKIIIFVPIGKRGCVSKILGKKLNNYGNNWVGVKISSEKIENLWKKMCSGCNFLNFYKSCHMLLELFPPPPHPRSHRIKLCVINKNEGP